MLARTIHLVVDLQNSLIISLSLPNWVFEFLIQYSRGVKGFTKRSDNSQQVDWEVIYVSKRKHLKRKCILPHLGFKSFYFEI